MRLKYAAVLTALVCVGANGVAQTESPSITPLSPAPIAVQPYAIGVDTVATITTKLGKPNSVTRLGDGSTVMSYVSTKAHMKGSSFIPIVGLFAGGAKGHVDIKTFVFDADGKLKNFSLSASNSNCRAGLTGAGCK